MLLFLMVFYVYMAILSASNFLFQTGFPIKQEQVSSPLSAQILEFCESELFPAESTTKQNSEVASTSNCCYDDHSSYTCTNLSFPPDIIKYPAPTVTTDTTDLNNFSIIFDEEITENNNNNNNNNDISNSVNLDFTINTSPHLNLPQYGQCFSSNQQDQFDLTQLLQNQIPLTNDQSLHPYDPHGVPPPALPVVCEDDSLSSKFMRLNNNCSFMDPSSISSYLSGNTNPHLPAVETCGIFNGDLSFLGELDFMKQGDNNNNGIFCPDPLPPPYNSQALSNESQHPVNGGGSCPTPLASEITSLETETFRTVTNKLTTEERKEKIHRYLKKRNERNFSKKIKYACRKTLADSRPRVRGRFAKNDEFGEINHRSNSHEEDTIEDVKPFHVVVKEEDENFESSDIFAHISGVNSFKCNYPIQSWI